MFSNFVEFARDFGLIIERPISDGVIHRVPLVEKAARGNYDNDGAYFLRVDKYGEYGHVYDHSTQRTATYRNGACLCRDILKTGKIEERLLEEKRGMKHMAEIVQHLYHEIAVPVKAHSYLKRKGVLPYSAKIDKRSDALVIPLKDMSGKIQSIQRIYSDGIKRFAKGGKIKGCFCPFGKRSKYNMLIVCEGFATGASIHEATDIAVAAAMSANNLEYVVRDIRNHKRCDNMVLVIAADGDEAGIKAAKKALRIADSLTRVRPALYYENDRLIEAKNINMNRIVIPSFTLEEQLKGATDFNDIHSSRGLEEVRKQILEVCEIAVDIPVAVGV